MKGGKISENIWQPMGYERSVTVQRHRQSENLKVQPTFWLTDWLPGIGDRDATASKNNDVEDVQA